MIERLKQRWKVETGREVAIILAVFSLTGFAILYVKKPVLAWLHVSPDTTLWVKIPLIILLYQILLLAFGAVLGQGRFFWEKEKRLFALLARPFRIRN